MACLDCAQSMLFVDYSSVFQHYSSLKVKTITLKLENLGFSPTLRQWIYNLLSDRPQAVRVDRQISSSITLSTGAPQGCVLSPLLYSLYSYDCVATSDSTTIIKFADDTVVVGLISDNDKRAYLQEIKRLVSGEQPPSECQQDKGANSRLQHKTGAELPTHCDQWGFCGESR